MATIIEIGRWTVSEEVGDHMVETGLLFRCDHEHVSVTEEDKPIYHRHHGAPSWLGFATMMGAIRGAEGVMEQRRKAEADAEAG
jgi:hypothetical protein